MAFFETSDGVKLFYQQKGEGNPVVLIHGRSATNIPSMNLARSLRSYLMI